MTETPTLYYDLGSPYAYLAVERAATVLGVEPRLQPVLVGGIFVERGHGSWAHTAEREARIEEIEARAERYGLPPLRWPRGWPNDTLTAMRAAVWAEEQGAGEEFARLGFRRAFVEGADLSDLEQVTALGEAAGLDAGELVTAIARPETKEALRRETAHAWKLGVTGVPTIVVGGQAFFGDDRLWAAATTMGASPL